MCTIIVTPRLLSTPLCLNEEFCLDQHQMSETAHDQTDDKYKGIVEQLQRSITAPRQVLMLLHPVRAQIVDALPRSLVRFTDSNHQYSQPIVLSRAWCLVSGLLLHRRAQTHANSD